MTTDRLRPSDSPNNETKIGKLRVLVRDLLHEHQRDDALPTSARFLFYELVQRGQIDKHPTGKRRADQDLHVALMQLRESGEIPWGWIIDETRSLEDYTGYASIKIGVLNQLQSIDLDPWGGKPPLILTESRSLAGVLRGVASEYCVRIASTNGQCGGFLRTDIAPKLKPGDVVLYLGDLDLAGDQIEENTRRVLEQVIGDSDWVLEQVLGRALQWERLAITKAQVTRHRLPTIVKHDRRYKDGRPHEAVETEALSQTVLVRMLRRRLDELLREPLSRVQARADRQRRRISAALRRMKP